MWKKIGLHSLYWLFAALFLWLFIKSRSPEQFMMFEFMCLLMPVTIATAYVLNYYLLNKLLLRKLYVQFAIYGLFTFVFSLYLQMIFITIYFAMLADLTFANLGPVAGNIIYIGTSTYFIIFLSAGIFLFRKNINVLEAIPTVLPEPQKKIEAIRITSNRKSHLLMPDDIQYVESLGNYVKIHTVEQSLVSKEKISKLQERLPEEFLRIHRSFLVNTNHIQSFGKEFLMINDQQLNISRTYKKAVSSKLFASSSADTE
ncbi:MAG: LytTR family DNA-binding domain-containing protein [Bacteroidota bacterium]